MDQTLVEYTKDDINGEQRGHDEDQLIRDRLLKNLRISGESAADGCWQIQFAHGLFNNLRGALEKTPGKD